MKYKFPPSFYPYVWAIFDGTTQLDGTVTRGHPDPTVPNCNAGYNATMMVGNTEVILWAETPDLLSEKIDQLLNG